MNSCINNNARIEAVGSKDFLNVGLYLYSNKHYEMSIIDTNLDSIKFDLKDLKSGININGYAHLIKVDGEIPEGTNRIDYNNPEDLIGIKCDSAYSFCSKNFCIYFAMESITKKRLDFGIYNTSDSIFKESSHTLLLKQVN